MKTTLYSMLAAALLIGTCLAQSTAPTSAPADSTADQPRTETRFAPGVQLRVELDKSVDAKKAKPGDAVVVKMMDELMADDKVMAPRGAKITGHLVEVTAHQGDAPSTLGIAFDKIVLPDGKEVPLDATIQAIARPEMNYGFGQPGAMGGNGNPGYGSIGGNNPMGRMGVPPAPGVSPAPGNPNSGNPNSGNPNSGNPSNVPGDPAPQTINGQLTPSSQGVINMSGVTLSTGNAGNSVLTSEKHNVKLDSGTQMVLHTR